MIKIRYFTTEKDPYYQEARQFIKECMRNNIYDNTVREVRIDDNVNAREYLLSNNISYLPVFEMGKVFIVGFHKKEIAKKIAEMRL